MYGLHCDKKPTYALKGAYKAQRYEQQWQIDMFPDVVVTVVKH